MSEVAPPATQILAYIPVIHAGYEQLLRRHPEAGELLLIGRDFASLFPPLAKEIRALEPSAVVGYLQSAFPALPVRVIQPDDLPGAIKAATLLVPDEQLLRDIVQTWRLDIEGRAVVYDQTFLRWDRKWSLAERPADYQGAITAEALARQVIGLCELAGGRSSDWWRQVGAAVTRDGQLLEVAHNQHRPTEYSPYLDGDPRNEFHRGVRPDLSTAIHAEAELIARFARTGRPTAGADIYVSALPCPTCSRLIASAGFRRCYFRGSYAMLDGPRVLAAAGVELIWVDTGSGPGPDSDQTGPAAEPHP